MAEVHLASQLGPGGFERRVALKHPLPHLAEDAESVAMFLDEARISAQLSHRNIVSVYEVDQHEGRYFIAMEYVDGQSLRALIKRSWELQRPVPLPVAGAIAREALAALAYAHDAPGPDGRPLQLVHRDVTPANILVTIRGEVKLMDFGIARAAERLAATRTGSVKGTLAFMSPEQARGQPVDRRADLYSFAATLYELLTLKRAFPDEPRAVRTPNQRT